MSARSSLPAALTPGARASERRRNGRHLRFSAASSPQGRTAPPRRHPKNRARQFGGKRTPPRNARFRAPGAQAAIRRTSSPTRIQKRSSRRNVAAACSRSGAVIAHCSNSACRPVHRHEPVAQFAALRGQPDMDRAAVVRRSCLLDIAVFDHFLEVIRDVRAEIAAAQRQLADRHLGVAEVEQHQRLHIVDVANIGAVEFQLHDFKKLPVKPSQSAKSPRDILRSCAPRLPHSSRRS